jgi:glycosyltransferase involved in cell wall biosynthesis
LQSREQVAALLGRVQAGLVLFHPAPNNVRAQPNKLFEYMSAGVPVIASDFPLWREVVEGEGCGLLVDPFNAVEVAEAVAHILGHPEEAEAMGRRGRAAVEQRFNWAREEATLVRLYRDVLGC